MTEFARISSPRYWAVRRWAQLRGDRPPKPAGRLGEEREELLRSRAHEAGLDAEPDTFVLYRILGNDLPPRHRPGQSLANLEFVIDREPELPHCEKRWIVNRIADARVESEIISVLRERGQAFTHIPLDVAAYGGVPWALEDLPRPDFLETAEFEAMDEESRTSAWLAAYRHRTCYAIDGNGARNLALDDGRLRAKWVLPFDGNTFVSEQAWQRLRADVAARGHFRYFAVPMARVTDNRRLLDPDFAPNPLDEPQLMFRRDAPERFSLRRPYGRRPKVELFWRLGVPGPWSLWRSQPWDLPYPEPSAEFGEFSWAGWVARLSSGVSDLESRVAQSGARMVSRNAAISSLLKSLDGRSVGHWIGTRSLGYYDEEILDEIAVASHQSSLRDAILTTASAALTRGPASVLDKTSVAPSNDPHDYWSPAPYWWPDPQQRDGRPYVRRDGQRRSEAQVQGAGAEAFDRTSLQQVIDDVTVLALAWRITGERDFAIHGATLVRCWFLDPATAMNPHLRFAQVRAGHDDDTGQASGIVELKDLYFLLDAIRLLDLAKALSDRDMEQMGRWLRAYDGWLWTSSAGRKAAGSANNLAVAWLLQSLAIARYEGDTARVVRVARMAAAALARQVAPDGALTAELRRALPGHYVTFTLHLWVALDRLARESGTTIESGPDSIIERALEWLEGATARGHWSGTGAEPPDPDHLAVLARLVRGTTGRLLPPLLGPYAGIAPFWQAAGPGPLARVSKASP